MPETKFTPLEFFRVRRGEVDQVLVPSFDTIICLPMATGGHFFRKAAAGHTQTLKLVESTFEPLRQFL